MLDHQLFVKHFTGLCELYSREATEALLDIYYLALQEMSNENFVKAVQRVIQSHSYSNLPAPAEFLGSSSDDAAIIALDKVERAVQKWGAYHTVVFDDPVIHATISALGGWIHVASAIPVDQWKWFVKDFIKTYKAFASNPRPEIPRVLVGIWEGQNCAINNKPMDTVYIGDRQRAIEWSDRAQEEKALSKAIEMADAISNKLSVR
uniref:DUF6475 domain-containing protein n=1 Tax=viral metagenome TaxID=1070528 RepID=A0A6H2A2B1_9ZZZZ